METLVCSSCLALNHIAKDQLSESIECGKCHRILLPDAPLDVDLELFEYFKMHSTLPILVDFWGVWVGAPHTMAEVFSNLSKRFKGDAVFIKMNSDAAQEMSRDLKITALPTFILFKEGKEYRRLAGNQIEAAFHSWLERYLRVKRKVNESQF